MQIKATLLSLVLSGSSTSLFAKEITRSFDLPKFTDVEAGGHFELDITIGKAQQVSLIAAEKDLELIDVSVLDGTLALKTKRKGFLWSTTPGSIKVVIQVPNLDGVDISGAGKLDAKNLDSKSFELAISGAATARLSGKVETFQLDISGSGKVRAFELEAANVEADVSGAGDVEVHATKIIDADVSGVGKLIYKGTPVKVMSKVSGVGNIRPRG